MLFLGCLKSTCSKISHNWNISWSLCCGGPPIMDIKSLYSVCGLDSFGFKEIRSNLLTFSKTFVSSNHSRCLCRLDGLLYKTVFGFIWVNLGLKETDGKIFLILNKPKTWVILRERLKLLRFNSTIIVQLHTTSCWGDHVYHNWRLHFVSIPGMKRSHLKQRTIPSILSQSWNFGAPQRTIFVYVWTQVYIKRLLTTVKILLLTLPSFMDIFVLIK